MRPIMQIVDDCWVPRFKVGDTVYVDDLSPIVGDEVVVTTRRGRYLIGELQESPAGYIVVEPPDDSDEFVMVNAAGATVEHIVARVRGPGVLS